MFFHQQNGRENCLASDCKGALKCFFYRSPTGIVQLELRRQCHCRALGVFFEKSNGFGTLNTFWGAMRIEAVLLPTLHLFEPRLQNVVKRRVFFSKMPKTQKSQNKSAGWEVGGRAFDNGRHTAAPHEVGFKSYQNLVPPPKYQNQSRKISL